jgi:dGTPase
MAPIWGWSLWRRRSHLLVDIIGAYFDAKKYAGIASLKEKVSVLRAMAIQRLISGMCRSVYGKRAANASCGTFDQAITEHIPATPTLKKIQSISFSKIYKSKPVIEREVAGFEVLKGLLETFVPAVGRFALRHEKGTWYHTSLIKLLPADYQMMMEKSGRMYESLLILLDFISGMTDSHALSLYRNIKGISFSGQ